MNEKEQLSKRRDRYLRFLVISLFVFALFHSINPFFYRFFFWISFGMGAMTLYYHISLKKIERGNQAQYRPQWQSGKRMPPQDISGNPKIKNGVAIAIGIGLFLFLLPVVVGLFSSDSTTETNTDTSTDTDSDSSESESTPYDEAYSLYNEQDYRGAATTLWGEVSNGIPDTKTVLLMGDSYYGLKNLDSTYVWYSKAYERGERSAFLCHVIAYILDDRGDSQEAIKYYKEAVELDTTKADVLLRLAELEPENAEYYLAKKRVLE